MKLQLLPLFIFPFTCTIISGRLPARPELPDRPIIAYGNKKSQQITRTGIELFGGEKCDIKVIHSSLKSCLI